MHESTRRNGWIAYLLAAAAAVCLPLLLWRFSLLSSPDSNRQLGQVFKVFGILASAGLAVAAWFELTKAGRTGTGRVVSVVLAALVGFLFLRVISTDIARTFDYSCYENAAQALLDNRSPYPGCYLYPPLLSQTMALARRTLAWGAAQTGLDVPGQTLWNGVFYLYQCMQYVLVVGAYVLCYLFSRAAGLGRVHAALLSASLLVFNGPLLRTLEEKQVNLLVLDIVLAVLLTVWRHPALAGFAVAFGTHVKLYPAVLALPFLLSGRTKALLWSILAIAGIAAAPAALGGGAAIWLDFAAMMRSFPAQPNPGNISIDGVLASCFGYAGWPAVPGTASQQLASVLAALAKFGVCAWIALRIAARAGGAASDRSPEAPEDRRRFYDDCMDLLAMGLLVSPVVWDHHFVVMVPYAIWSVARRGSAYPWQTGVAVFLMLGQASLDMFPLHLHRTAGLLILLGLSQPQRVFGILRRAAQAASPAL